MAENTLGFDEMDDAVAALVAPFKGLGRLHPVQPQDGAASLPLHRVELP